MIDRLFHDVSGLGRGAYAIIFLLVMCESSLPIGFLVPGETAAVLGGVLAANDALDVRVVLALVAGGAILGNLVGYELGRRLRRPWVLRHGGRFGLRAEHLRRVDAFFRRHGGKTVLLGRLTPLLRALVPFVAGASRLPYRVFVFYTVLGGVCWSAAFVALGYLAGESWQAVHRWLGRAGLAILLIVLAIAAVAWLRFRLRKK
ncbi:MAG: DedA family protein [Thermoguttaceae bacterium]